MNKPSLSIFAAAALALVPGVDAAVKLPAIFSDHLVLQSDVAVPVWGWAEPGEDVSVTFAGQTPTTKADSDGKWSVKLAALKASAEPQILTVKGRNTLTVNDVLVGEVWLCRRLPVPRLRRGTASARKGDLGRSGRGDDRAAWAKCTRPRVLEERCSREPSPLISSLLLGGQSRSNMESKCPSSR